MFKITAYGVRPVEVSYFKDLNKYDYELNLVSEMLDHENAIDSKGSDGVLVRGNCLADRENLQKFADWGIKYVFTRTVGYDHIDLMAAKELGIKVARVPGYSPYAVAELAMTLGMSLFRKVASEINATHDGNFIVSDSYFSREIHSSIVGIIGAGRIGRAEASLYSGMGATVLANDGHKVDAPEIDEYVPINELLKRSDIVSLHVPYIKGETDNLISTDQINLMKDDAILVNTARGQVVDLKAVDDVLSTGKLGGYGADVLIDESNIFGHEFKSVNDIKNREVVGLMKNYPNAIVTPHVGSFTEPALTDMITVSYDNFHEMVTTGKSKNEI
ncbi:NAD(P)-dependent oxidoreductase [Fructilactobacillus fructivorans]|uniref:NAD(P)-dependent oxidoreductase n=1 Tax=Fructilactobacillus fructivorans TaxID=1614 RepID=UPI00070FDE0E|nr:NAD(P)-dependent oxidoreductase [Fructilactobacillus fructivorans]KRN41329.1 D-lactate dehydrogenase [Fructilactobacillus fructivorans]